MTVIHRKGPRRSVIRLPVVERKDVGSSVEAIFADGCDRRGIPYRTQRPLAGSRLDFDLWTMNTLVRIQGDYWHSIRSRVLSDVDKLVRLLRTGRRVVDVWEKDIKTRIDWVFDTQIGARAA